MKEEIQKIELVTRELSEDIVNPIKESNEKVTQLVNVFGQLFLRRKELEDELVKLEEGQTKAEDDFKTQNDELRSLVSALEKEYPRGQIDLQKGTITFDPSVKDKSDEDMQVVK